MQDDYVGPTIPAASPCSNCRRRDYWYSWRYITSELCENTRSRVVLLYTNTTCILLPFWVVWAHSWFKFLPTSETKGYIFFILPVVKANYILCLIALHASSHLPNMSSDPRGSPCLSGLKDRFTKQLKSLIQISLIMSKSRMIIIGVVNP